MVSPFDQPPPPTATTIAPEYTPESAIDRNNKLLGFSMPEYRITLLDYSLQRSSLSLSAQLHGMFFLAESPWTMSPNENEPPQQGAELTCYRRNLFQITGSVTLPRGLRYVITDHGDRIPILAQELVVSASESVENNAVKIISVPWKTPAATGPGSTDGSNNINNSNNPKSEQEPPPIALDTMAGHDFDTDYATVPFSWKRLQFRVATANNGRRKELQQHFIVRLKLIATLSTGAKITVCEVKSGPVIVRGRSPRNFQSRKDLPLSGSAAASSRKNAQAVPTSASASVSRLPTTTRPSRGPVRARAGTKRSSPDEPLQHGITGSTSQQSSPDWKQIPPARSSPEVPRTADSHQQNIRTPMLPVSLSLLDDDDNSRGGDAGHVKDSNSAGSPVSSSPTSSPSDDMPQPIVTYDSSAPPAKMRKLSHCLPQSLPKAVPPSSYPLFSANALQQTFAPTIYSNENADLLYEYFPLGLDDWQPPVDAVYRPHVVHHTSIPDMKFVASRGRSKRYFAPEDAY